MMNLTELARTKVRKTGERSWFDVLPGSAQREILAELKKWGKDQPLTPFAEAVIEKFKLDRKIPCVRETLRNLKNGKAK